MSTYRFCLQLIVKDEAPIIRRALDSMKNFFDYYIISDTGSTDGTPEVIKAWAEENNKKGEVIFNPWVNFGHNRSLLMEYAYKNAPLAEYFCWLDADEVVITDPNNPVSYLTLEDVNKLYLELNASQGNIIKIETHFGGIKYLRWSMVRNNQLYVWKQPVHEYLEATKYGSEHVVTWIYNLARKEGNSSRNPDRYKKDSDMFLKFLEDHPNEPRALFYLAQTFEGLDREKSIEYYTKRIATLTGYNEERYVACLRVGRMHVKEDEKIKAWMYGQTICPHRLECLFELMMMHYAKGNHQQVVGIGMMTGTNRVASINNLFTENHIYDFNFDFIFAISCYYTNEHQKGIEANLRAIKKAPQNLTTQIIKNMKLFKGVVPKLGETLMSKATLIVLDDFYPDPYAIRAYALAQEFEVKGNYPGTRTGYQLETDPSMGLFGNIKKRFEEILGKPITYWPDGYNSAFQSAVESDKSWLHRDKTEWSGIVFLSPNPPPDSGTKFYKHIATDKECSNGDETLESRLNEDTYKPEAWELIDTVGNRFNRIVFFKGLRTHTSANYFGSSKETSRLFQMFFFNTN